MNINERLAKLESGMEENAKTLWRVFEAVYGNGKPGLIADVQSIRQLLESKKNHGQNWQWIITTVIAAAAVAAAWLK